MEKGPYYCRNLTSRILKSFSDRVTKQLGWNEVRGFSIKIDSMKAMNNGKLAVVGTFKVSSTAPVTFKYPKLYSNATIRWSGEKLGTEAGLTEKYCRQNLQILHLKFKEIYYERINYNV